MKLRRRIEKLRCAVPGCRFKARMAHPGQWCRRHWSRWADWGVAEIERGQRIPLEPTWMPTRFSIGGLDSQTLLEWRAKKEEDHG